MKKILESMHIGFLGFGNIAKAITQGIIQEDFVEKIFYYDIKQNNEIPVSSPKLQPVESQDALEQKSDVIIFAVKPKDMEKAVRSAKPSKQHYISVAAGISLDKILQWNPGIRFLGRAMPNIGAFARMSVTAIYANNPETMRIAGLIFGKAGITIPLEKEEAFHIFTALAGSGPAFVLLFLQAMVEAGIRGGLDYETSFLASLHTLRGTTELLLKEVSEENRFSHPAEWIRKITSPGGTTIEGLATLEKYRFRYAIYEAIHNATKKSRKLGK